MLHLAMAALAILIFLFLYKISPKKRLGPFPSEARARVRYVLLALHRVLSLVFFVGLLGCIGMLLVRAARDLLGT